MKHSHRLCKAILIALILTLSAAPSGALAGDKLVLAGAEGGAGDTENYYTYAGLVAPLVGDHLGNGLVQRYWIDFLGYSYETDQEIDAQAVGLEGALGYQKSGPAGWGAAYLGLRYNNTDLSPDDPANRTEGEHLWVKTQLEGEMNFAETWKLGGIASYTFSAESFWLRTRLLRQLEQGLSTGPEVVFMGDPNYRAWQFGWVVTGFKPWQNVEIGLKAGVRITDGTAVNGLVGIELSRMF